MESMNLNVITHLHTYASNGPASSLDQVVKSILIDVFGTIPEGLIWRECFTSTHDILQILKGKRTRKRIDILFITDHMSSKHHRFDSGLLELATEERKIGLGCEIQTVRFSEKHDRFLIAPEILLYGDGIDREFNGKKYTGLDDATLALLYEECTICGSGEPEISKVNEFCKKHGIACAMAHPFDCQELGLEETLDLISTFSFVEAVNGGFPHHSARALQEYIAFHNDIIETGLGHSLLECELTDEQKRRVEKICTSEVIVPFGGSDAHLHHFDRTITRFSTVPNKTQAVDFVKMMLECSESAIMHDDRVVPVGHGGTMVGLYIDVIGILYKNISIYWIYFRSPRIWPDLSRTLITTGFAEFKKRIKLNKNIALDYKHQLHIGELQKTVDNLKREKLLAHSFECPK